MPALPSIKILWSQPLAARLNGLALAREKGLLLAWDDNSWLYLVNRQGVRQGQMRLPGALAAACCADDGSALAAIGSQGEIWFLAPDLTMRWTRTIAGRPVAAALDSLGQYLAVADAAGGLHFFDRHGWPIARCTSPRPLVHLTFVPAAPWLLGCADYGLIACADLRGHWRWQHGLVIHVGSLAVTGTGSCIALACFTEGIQRYRLGGENCGRLATPEPCRQLVLSFEGQALVAGLSDRLFFLDAAGNCLCCCSLEKQAVALALAPLGDQAFAALADGRLAGLEIKMA